MGSHYISWEHMPSEGYGSTIMGTVACYSPPNAPCRRKDSDKCLAVESIARMGEIGAWHGAKRRNVFSGVIDVRLADIDEYYWKYASEGWHPSARWAE